MYNRYFIKQSGKKACQKLLTLYDQLETQITQNQTLAKALMQVVLKEAFTYWNNPVLSVKLYFKWSLIHFIIQENFHAKKYN